MKYLKNQCFKSLKEIMAEGAKVGRRGTNYVIFHKSGQGGGLSVPVKIVEKCFGKFSFIMPELKLNRTRDGRNIYKAYIDGRNQLIYEDWLIGHSEYHLPDELFEI